MAWECLRCNHLNDGNVPMFAENVTCEKCGAVHETDWECSDPEEGNFCSWVTNLVDTEPKQ